MSRSISVLGAGGTWGISLWEYCSRGVAFLGRSDADREATHVILTAAALYVACLIGLSCLPSFHQMSRNDQIWKGGGREVLHFVEGDDIQQGWEIVLGLHVL